MAKKKDNGAKQENNGRESKCEIITIILRTIAGDQSDQSRIGDKTNLLSIRHGDLANHCTNVDEEVEILQKQSVMLIDGVQEKAHHINTRCSQSRIDHHTLTILGLGDKRAIVTLLFSNKWRDVRLETPCAKAHDNDCNGKRCKCPIRMHDDWWDGRDDKDDMPDESNKHRDSDSFVSPPLLVCYVGAKERSDVTPIIAFSAHFERQYV